MACRPCFNEAANLPKVIGVLKELYPQAEIILVDDASTDNSVEIAQTLGIRVVSHQKNLGNGACIKTGARAASHEVTVFLDSDGQHAPGDIRKLLDRLYQGFDMVVGARAATSHASLFRRVANNLYNRLASGITRYPIQDLTSGFRAVKTQLFRQFLYLYPNRFSYPTTCTMAFIR